MGIDLRRHRGRGFLLFIIGFLIIVAVQLKSELKQKQVLRRERELLYGRRTDNDTEYVEEMDEEYTADENTDADTEREDEDEYETEETTAETSATPTTERKRTCQAKERIAFAKTHKTGSSTIQNILFRFGDERNLNFAVPERSWMFSFKEPFKSETVMSLPWSINGYDIFAFHCVWNYKEVMKVVPNAFFTTILRDPIDCYESNYVYMGLQRAYRMDVNEFARKKAFLDPPRRKNAIIGKDQMLWDLGVTNEDLEKPNIVYKKIREFDDQFGLVMLAEYFDESLVLLADKLCWDLKDVRYLKQNARTSKSKNIIDPGTRSIMTHWLRADYMLYSYFKSRFQEEVEKYGKERLERDTARLRELNRQLKEECVLEVADNSKLKGDFRMAMDFVEGYVINPDKKWCFPYATSEPKYSVHVRKMAQLRAGFIGKKKLNSK